MHAYMHNGLPVFCYDRCKKVSYCGWERNGCKTAVCLLFRSIPPFPQFFVFIPVTYRAGSSGTSKSAYRVGSFLFSPHFQNKCLRFETCLESAPQIYLVFFIKIQRLLEKIFLCCHHFFLYVSIIPIDNRLIISYNYIHNS